MREFWLAVILGIGVLLLILMAFGWRARMRRQSHLPRPANAPASPGTPITAANVLYVATTLAGQPLERLAVPGLGFRARGRLEVTSAGLLLTMPGERDVFIPRTDLIGADRATWTIDRAVETDGLLLIGWRLGDQAVDSYLRITDGHDLPELVTAVSELAPATTERES